MSNKSRSTKNTSAPAKPATPAEVLAPEGAQASSQATTQAETGNSQPTEKVVTPPTGAGGAQIVVTAMKDGFRRAGRAWSKEPTAVPIDEFTQEQLEALATEPMLFVAFVDDTAE